MNNIDPSRIRWIKNVKRDGGQSWAYFEDYTETNQQFALHWPHSKRGNAKQPNKGDIIILFQNYKNQGPRITHLVEVVDDDSFIDSQNPGKYETAREVKLIYRSKNIINGLGFRYAYKAVAYGTVHSIHFLDSSSTVNVIQETIFKLFKKDRDSYFHIKHINGKTHLNLPPNKLFNESQFVEIGSNIITLIGENGCGKSAVLESIFKASDRSEEFRFICFSSGQNELFSKIFKDIQATNKDFLLKKQIENEVDYEDDTFDIPIKAFYFNKQWTRLLIFFASVLFPNGRVRDYLNSLKLSNENEIPEIKLSIPFRIDWNYVDKVRKEKELESSGHFSLFMQGKFHKKLTWFIESIGRGDYEYEAPIRKSPVFINEETTLRIFQEKSSDLIFNFFWFGSIGNTPIFDLPEVELFINEIELDDLSDGEYQILSIYALLDHFDKEETIFLFDEIDSHLYYQNIKKLWQILSKVKGKIITTTHISDSILNNTINDIKLVEKGRIEEKMTLKDLAKRASNIVGKKQYEYELAARAENIVLVDDEVDWIIFQKLVEKKTNSNLSVVFDRIIPFKRTSSYNNTSETFGKGKLEFVKELIEIVGDKPIMTRNIFMICDRDKLSKNSINDNMEVNIHNDYKSCKKFNSTSAFLFALKRLEIENYLLSYTMLEAKGVLNDLIDKFPRINFSRGDTFDGIADIEEFDAKELLHPLYKANGFEEVKLNEIVNLIPANEISSDLENLYNFIVSKIN